RHPPPRRLRRSPQDAAGPARARGGRMRTGLIVDAYSTGAALAPRFHAAGVRTLHVQSRPLPPAFYQRSFRPDCFALNVVHEDDLDATLAALAGREIDFVLAGAETGVPLAD